MTATRPGFSTRHFSSGSNCFHSSMVQNGQSGLMPPKLSCGRSAQLAAQMDAGEFGHGLRAFGHDSRRRWLVPWERSGRAIRMMAAAPAAAPNPNPQRCFNIVLIIVSLSGSVCSCMNPPHHRFDQWTPRRSPGPRATSCRCRRVMAACSARQTAQVSRCAWHWSASSRSSNPSTQATRLSRHSAQFMAVPFG